MRNWRGKPPTTLETVVGLIANTTTKTGLKVRAAADKKTCQTGLKITDEEIENLALTRNAFHGEWSLLFPRPTVNGYPGEAHGNPAVERRGRRPRARRGTSPCGT